jgi:hypothetical protein
MLGTEDNQTLTQVGPGTPMGAPDATLLAAGLRRGPVVEQYRPNEGGQDPWKGLSRESVRQLVTAW